MPEITRNCPFCDNQPKFGICPIYVAWVISDEGTQYWVHCEFCRASGPEGDTAEDAIRFWNEGIKFEVSE